MILNIQYVQISIGRTNLRCWGHGNFINCMLFTLSSLKENSCVLAFQSAGWSCLGTKSFSREKGRTGSTERRTEWLKAAASPGGTGWFWWHMSLWSLWESGAAPNLLMWAQLNIRAAELPTGFALLPSTCWVCSGFIASQEECNLKTTNQQHLLDFYLPLCAWLEWKEPWGCQWPALFSQTQTFGAGSSSQLLLPRAFVFHCRIWKTTAGSRRSCSESRQPWRKRSEGIWGSGRNARRGSRRGRSNCSSSRKRLRRRKQNSPNRKW